MIKDISDNQSQVSSASSARKRIDKHCNECNGKKITGKQWPDHKKTVHKQEDVQFTQCDGADCKQCQTNLGKFSSLNPSARFCHPSARFCHPSARFCHPVPGSATRVPGSATRVPGSATRVPGSATLSARFCHPECPVLPPWVPGSATLKMS
jgi:hypothetical protein